MEYKIITYRMPKEIWTFLKQKCLEREMSMSQIITERLNKYKSKQEKEKK